MQERTAVLAASGEECRWAAITENTKRCEGLADWVLSGAQPTIKLCATHLVAKGLMGVAISAPLSANTTRYVAALRRLADAIEAASTATKR